MFQSLAQHPPTPPREVTEQCIDDAISFLDTSITLDSSCAPLVKPSSDADLNTPPPSSPLDKASSRAKSSKRLRFLPEPLPRPDTGNVTLRVLPPSREGKCKKSILKPYTPSPSCESANHDPFSSPLAGQSATAIARMLESIVQQLAGQDVISRHEAYQTLSNCLKAYDHTAESDLLEKKLPLLQDFLRRDLVSTGTDVSSPINRLPLLALKTTQALLYTITGARAFNQEFLAFLVDQATITITTKGPSKEFMLNYMHVLTQQKIYIKAMTRNRAQKLYSALSTVHERITGNNVYRLRLMIYQRFVRCCPQPAVENLQQWLPHVFHGMLSDNKDIRGRSIETANAAGEHIQDTKQLAQAVLSILNQDVDEERKYYAHFTARLEELLKQPDHKEHVPQIWGAVMLLIQANGKLIENWLTSHQWLRLLETCFNTSDSGLNLHAWLAWNKTIYAARAILGTSPAVMKRLRAPITGHLQRKTSGKITEAAFSTYCGLLYYAFAPTSPVQQRGQCWKMLVHDVVLKVVQSNPTETGRLSIVISGLLSRNNTIVWDAGRALRTSEEPFALHETPRLDAHWIRSNIEIVGEVVKLLMSRSPPEDQSTLWASLMSAISEAASKEIKASLETRKASAAVISILCSICTTDSNVRHSSKSLTALAVAAIEAITPSLACEPILSRSDSGILELAATPSRHAGKPAKHLESPITALMAMLGSLNTVLEINMPLRIAAQEILRPCWQTRATRKAKTNLLRTCAAAVKKSSMAVAQPKVQSQLWQAIAELATSTISGGAASGADTASTQTGPTIRDLVSLLIDGLLFSDTKSLRFGYDLFSALRQFIRSQAGESAVLIELYTPIMRQLEFGSDTCSSAAAIQYTIGIIEGDIVIPSSRLIDQARKTLWGTEIPADEEIGPHWLGELYTLIDEVLVGSYKSLDKTPGLAVQSFLRSLTEYLEAPKSSQRTTIAGPELFLWNTKVGMSAYLKDEDDKLKGLFDRGFDLKADIRKLWLSVLRAAARLQLHSNAVVRVIEDALCAGFQSRSKTIANVTIAAWNKSFGAETTLEYPDHLRATFTRLRHLAEVELPGFKDFEGEANLPEDDNALFLWLSSTNDTQVEEVTKSSLAPNSTPRRSLHTAGNSAKPAAVTPLKKVRKGLSSTPVTPPTRLRHDDSQIRFVAVESSPIDPANNESQLLTDRQKEVKERQQADAAIFSDIRSSPVAETQQAEYVVRTEPRDVSVVEDAQQAIVEPIAQAAATAPELEEEPDSTIPPSEDTAMEDVATTTVHQAGESSSLEEPAEMTSPPEQSAEIASVEAEHVPSPESVHQVEPEDLNDPAHDAGTMDIDVPQDAGSDKQEPVAGTSIDEEVVHSADLSAIPPQAEEIEGRSTVEEPLTPYVVIDAIAQKQATPQARRSASKRKRASEQDEDLIVVKQKKTNSPSLRSSLKDPKTYSAQKTPNTSFNSVVSAFPANSPRKRPASKIYDEEGSSQLIERAAKRRRSGRKSQSQSQQDSQEQEQSQQQQEDSQQSQSQSSRRSSRLSGEISSLVEGMKTPRKRRKSRKLVESTAQALTPGRSVHEDEDELSQDIVPDTALPPNTPGSHHRRRGSKLGEIPTTSSSAPVLDEDFHMQTTPAYTAPASSWPADDTTVDLTVNIPAGRPAAARSSPSKLNMVSTAQSTPATPRAQTANQQQGQTGTPQTPSSSLARSIIGRLYGILDDCKKLVLGNNERREREELEDMAHELGREITRATRRGNE